MFRFKCSGCGAVIKGRDELEAENAFDRHCDKMHGDLAEMSMDELKRKIEEDKMGNMTQAERRTRADRIMEEARKRNGGTTKEASVKLTERKQEGLSPVVPYIEPTPALKSKEVIAEKKGKVLMTHTKSTKTASLSPMTLNSCPCCGGECKGQFIAGHDGRVHGQLLKWSKGKMKKEEMTKRVQKMAQKWEESGYKMSMKELAMEVKS